MAKQRGRKTLRDKKIESGTAQQPQVTQEEVMKEPVETFAVNIVQEEVHHKQEAARPMFIPEKVTHIWTHVCQPLENLKDPAVPGIYDVSYKDPSGKDGTLILELIHRPEGNVFIVKKISPDGFLSDRLMEGFQIEIKNIHRHHPELDQHIRGLFALNNIMLSSSEQNPQMNSASSGRHW